MPTPTLFPSQARQRGYRKANGNELAKNPEQKWVKRRRTELGNKTGAAQPAQLAPPAQAITAQVAAALLEPGEVLEVVIEAMPMEPVPMELVPATVLQATMLQQEQQQDDEQDDDYNDEHEQDDEQGHDETTTTADQEITWWPEQEQVDDVVGEFRKEAVNEFLEEQSEEVQGVVEGVLGRILQSLNKTNTGRGITNDTKPGTWKGYKWVGKLLCVAALRCGAEAGVDDIFDAFYGDTSAARQMLVESLTAPGTSAIMQSQKLQKLKSIAVKWSETSEQEVQVAINELKAAKKVADREVEEAEKEKQLQEQMRGINDVFEAGSALPAAVFKAMGPPLQQRLDVHRKLLATTTKKLVALKKAQEGIELKTASGRELVFDCLFLIQTSVPPQRKSPWQTMQLGAPETPFFADGSVNKDFLGSSPVYMHYRATLKLWGITQLRTKQGTVTLTVTLPAVRQLNPNPNPKPPKAVHLGFHSQRK